MPLISVVMPAFQAESTLARAVASVRAQTLRDWELIVVNDGSTDATGRVADECARDDARIKVLHLEYNVGAAAAMNRAWRGSVTPLLAVLDADDIALPERLARQAEHLARHAEISVLGAAAHFVDGHGGFLRTVTPPATHAELARRRWHTSPFIHPTVMMRREFLEATGGYQDGLRLGEDYDLWMRGFQQGGWIYENLPIPLLVYRTLPIQRWTMIKASARVRIRAGRREGRIVRGLFAALCVITGGLIEQTGVFAWRDLRQAAPAIPGMPGQA